VHLRRSWGEILEQLRADGAVVPAAPPTPPAETVADAAPSPWFVRVLLGIGAWVSALFLFGAIGIAVGKDGLLPIGALALAAGVGLLRTRGGEFLRQLGLSSSLVGQLAIAVGVLVALNNVTALATVGLVVEGLLVRVVAYPVHRFSSTLLAAAAGTTLLARLGVPAHFDLAVLALAAGAGALWIDQPRRLRPAGVDPWTPLGYGLVLALFGLLLLALSGSALPMWPLSDANAATGRLASGGLGLATVALALHISAEAGRSRPTPLHAAALAALALLGFATPASPGVAAAAGGLLLGLHRRNPALVALAIVFLITFLGLLYYSLAASLLVKAVLLMTAGVVLAAAAWLLHRRGAP